MWQQLRKVVGMILVALLFTAICFLCNMCAYLLLSLVLSRIVAYSVALLVFVPIVEETAKRCCIIRQVRVAFLTTFCIVEVLLHAGLNPALWLLKSPAVGMHCYNMWLQNKGREHFKKTGCKASDTQAFWAAVGLHALFNLWALSHIMFQFG